MTLFLIAASASFLPSIALWFTDHREDGNFAGAIDPGRRRRLDDRTEDAVDGLEVLLALGVRP